MTSQHVKRFPYFWPFWEGTLCLTNSLVAGDLRLALCAGNSPGPVNSPHKGPVTRKMFPFDDVIMHFRRLTLNFTQFHTVKTVKTHLANATRNAYVNIKSQTLVTMTSDVRHGVWNHRSSQLICLHNSATKEKNESLSNWPCVRESISDRWIPLTKGQ